MTETSSLRSFDPLPWIASRVDNTWTLIGSRCRACARLAAPADRFGCLGCGTSVGSLDRIPLSGRGTVVTAITIFQPLVAGVTLPTVIGRIALEEGPVICAQIEAPEELLTSGRKVEARMMPIGDGVSAWRFFITQDTQP